MMNANVFSAIHSINVLCTSVKKSSRSVRLHCYRESFMLYSMSKSCCCNTKFILGQMNWMRTNFIALKFLQFDDTEYITAKFKMAGKICIIDLIETNNRAMTKWRIYFLPNKRGKAENKSYIVNKCTQIKRWKILFYKIIRVLL